MKIDRINKSTTLMLICICFVTMLHAQIKETENITIGKTYSFESKTLEEDREIQIYVPTSYKDSIHKKYPVLYVLDGQDYFSAAVSFQKMLIKRSYFPEFIVVGIKTDQRKRRVLFSRTTTKFMDFLESELISYIDTNYRTNKQYERMLFGWEVAGGLGIEILAKRPNLFSGYILSSPSNLWDFRLNALEKNIPSLKTTKAPFLLMTAAPDENWLNDNKQLQAFFDKNTQQDFNWRYAILDREEHHTTPFKTLNEGIVDYFHNYKPISYRTLKQYDDFGGLAGLKAFYTKRGERFGISTKIDEITKMFILYTAVLENNYEQFVHYEKAFNNHIQTNTRDSWFHRYGVFYLKHKNIKEALNMYNNGLTKLGDSKLLYSGLGDVFVANGDKRKAKKAYKKALSIDPKYKRALEGIKEL